MPPINHLFQPKYIAVMVLSFAGFLLMYIATGGTIDLVFWDYQFEDLTGTEQLIAFIIGLVLLLGSAIYLFRDYLDHPYDDVSFSEPPFLHFLFNSTSSAPLWLGIRLYLGFEWLSSGWNKLDSEAWRNGDALEGYWSAAVAVPTEEGARAPITYDGWRQFIQYMLDSGWADWFSWVIIIGEIAVGIALILGAFTGIAAFFGAVMNVSFLLSGSTSANPVMLLLAILVILAWRVAGFLGLDRWLLPAVGTPWQHVPAGTVRPVIHARGAPSSDR